MFQLPAALVAQPKTDANAKSRVASSTDVMRHERIFLVCWKKIPTLKPKNRIPSMKSMTDMAGDLDTSTAQVLTAIRIVATRAGVTEVAAWATKEMEGYELEEELPAHRIWKLSIVGNMYNPVQGVIPGFHLGDLSIAKQHRDKATTYYCRDGVGEIERMIQSDDDQECAVESGNLATLINMGPTIKKGWICTQAWAQFSVFHLETVVSKARQTALKLCLECEVRGIELQCMPNDADEVERKKWRTVLREEGTKVAMRAAWETIKCFAD